jgi:ribosomal protein S10
LERKSKKKQVKVPSVSETNLEEDVQNIVKSGKNKIAGKGIPENIPPSPMDNVTFHSKESVQKWKYVDQRRITHKRELSQEALNCKEVMKLLEVAGLMKTLTNSGRCHEKLVKEYIVNITNDCSEGSEKFRNVDVECY